MHDEWETSKHHKETINAILFAQLCCAALTESAEVENNF